ncbi:MAG TPA: GTP-binding protein [Kofleriaceae bacterium]|jgi:G3E family GTPase|nr:GTP-binding protein [Kofleriaceae bacterium]
MADRHRIPVTVLTGFLGAGKTTLLNRILTEHHGQRIAVIENEFGEIGIDQALVVKADEEIFEMNNGCICCTVRGDLIRVLGNLMKRRDKFDRIIVETTGMANPGPVAQTFFVDDDVQADFRLDGIITLVDARHLELHLGEQQEAHEQVAFADVLVINKTDLVDAARLDDIECRLRRINAMAKVLRGQHADVPLATVLDVGGFDLVRALATRPTFLEPEYPFEWAGVYELAPGDHQLQLSSGPDPTMRVLVEPVADGTAGTIAGSAEQALHRMTDPARSVSSGAIVRAGDGPFELALGEGESPRCFTLPISRAGCYALFTQHLPAEFRFRLTTSDGRELAPIGEREFAASHTHDDAVSSVGLEFDRAFDEARLNAWLGRLLRERGADIFRMKGILAIAGADHRFVFQGVHMLFDGRPDTPWGDRPRRSQVVFIGKHLDRAALREGLGSCLA